MKNSEIIEYDDLIKISGANGPAALAAWLEQSRVQFFRGSRGRAATTRTALNAALGVLPIQGEQPSKATIQIR